MARKTTVNNTPTVRSNSFFETFQSLEDKIRDRAYAIFQSRDESEGDSLSDWLQAQSEVLTSIALEMREEDDQYVLAGELPESFSPDEIEIDVTEGMLSVGGTHVEKTKNSSTEINFMRRMSLPSDVDIERIASRFDDGELRLTLPKVRL